MRAALTSSPARSRAAVLALVASLLAHAALLGRERVREAPVTPARAINIALLQPPTAPVALPEPAPAALPAPRARSTRPNQPAPKPAMEAPMAKPDAPLMRLAGPATWHYRLRQGGQDGEALLDWQPQADGRYSLRLTRRIGERALPALESLGQTGSAGLAPQRFALQQGGRDRQPSTSMPRAAASASRPARPGWISPRARRTACPGGCSWRHSCRPRPHRAGDGASGSPASAVSCASGPSRPSTARPRTPPYCICAACRWVRTTPAWSFGSTRREAIGRSGCAKVTPKHAVSRSACPT